MSIQRIILVIGLAFLAGCQTAPSSTVVFTSGQQGYNSYRIPAVITAPNGDLLAFCEGRVQGADDFGNIDLVMKRSTDGGATWGVLQKIVDYKNLQAGNPAPVVDLLDPDYPKGRIFLFYNTGNNHENEVRKGNGLREAWYITSTDEGKTWSAPVNITTQVHRPHQPAAHPAYGFKEDWRAYANTPGHAIQLSEGTYKGRLYIPANHSAGDPLPDSRDYRAHAYYSDDHGKTFRLSEDVSFEGSNESMAAMTAPNALWMNSRNQRANVKSRIASISTDGGMTWDTTYYDLQLPDPINQASNLAFTEGNERFLAFCNAADTSRRDNLTLRLSRDGGKTWFLNRTVAKGPQDYTEDYAAYSDLVWLSPGVIGVLFEKKEYSEIVFERVKWR